MASTLPSPTSPERAASAAIDRIAVAASLAVAVFGAWGYLLYQSWAMDHMDLVDMAMPSLDAWGAGDLLLVFTMWSVMMVGMMAPTAAPMLTLFAGMRRGRGARDGPWAASAAFLAGYLVVWTGFSALATLAQWGLHAGDLLAAGLDRAVPAIGGAIAIGAGIYQWTPAKSACLAHCRSPLGFLLNEWRAGTGGALLMGMRHGLFCTGCCWALMLVMFAVGVMNLYWAAGLTVFVLLEKTFRFGAALARGAGVLLVAWGTWMLLA